MNRRSVVTVFRSLGVLAVVCTGIPLTAAAQTQTCGDSERAAYQNAVNAGATQAQLEEQFGKCRESTTQGLTAVITNFNTWYERMNSCGVHPQLKRAACDVEIRQTTGYGAFPAGSNEYARFCFDCDLNGTVDFSTLAAVHVTNDVSGTVPSWYHSVIADMSNAPAICMWGSGQAINVRVILSWAAQPTNCAYQPIWGNRIDFRARLDP